MLYVTVNRMTVQLLLINKAFLFQCYTSISDQKKPVQQVLTAPAINRLLVLCDGRLQLVNYKVL